MYKTLTLHDLKHLETTFVSRLGKICQRRRTTLKDIYRQRKTHESQYLFLERGGVCVTLTPLPDDGGLMVEDSVDMIQLTLAPGEIGRLDSMIQSAVGPSLSKKQQKKTMLDMLLDEFGSGAYELIGGKPYLVYDIETMGDISDRTQLTCEVTYAITSTDYATDHGEGDPYVYYDDVTVKELVQQMIDFDGYIVGYNNISFDNPVICHYAGCSQADIDLLNKKTIDLFLVVRELTGRRIGLTNVASALVGLEKTLGSGLEGLGFLTKYKETGKQKYLDTVKEYCKNDVKMTLAILLYLWKYGSITVGGENVLCSVDDIIAYGSVANAIGGDGVSDDAEPEDAGLF